MWLVLISNWNGHSDDKFDKEFNGKSRPICFPDVRNALARASRRERATTQTSNVQSLLQFWLWESDANEVCNQAKCDFYAMHLTGMVCTRVLTEAYQDVSDSVASDCMGSNCIGSDSSDLNFCGLSELTT